MMKRLFLLVSAFIAGSVLIIASWLSGLSTEAILFHIYLPQRESLSVGYGMPQLLMQVLLFAICLLVYHFFMGVKYFKWQLISIVCLLIFDVWYIESHFHIRDYYKEVHSETSFIKQNYVFPERHLLKFPMQKRNLIIIQVESLENTFQDKLHGGYFNENYIPEISNLADTYTDFTGMKILPYTTWTIASTVAMTMGGPLRLDALPKNHPLLYQKSKFKRKYFPKIDILNDILHEEGYTNVFLLGTNPAYAGQDDFFEQHGKTNIISLYDGKNAYDSDVYEAAKGVLKDLPTPFFLFVQTFDSHFEGRLNPACPKNHSEQIFDAYRCVSKEIGNLIDYLSKQPFYQNTTILLVGDHPNMSKKVCELIPCNDYIRSPTVIFINLPFSFQKREKRAFSMFDLFPTILASLGVEIKGNTLGLGVNLFSGEKSLIEEYGYRTVYDALRKNDRFFNTHFLMGM